VAFQGRGRGYRGEVDKGSEGKGSSGTPDPPGARSLE